jgi:hypothetical protein
MLPTKWKLFRNIQIAVLAIYTPVLLLDIYGIFTKPVSQSDSTSFIIGQVTFLLITFIYCGNILLNLRLLTAVFIKNQADAINRRLSIALLILFLLILIIFSIAFTSVLYTEFFQLRPYKPASKTFYIVILLYLFVLIVTGIYTSIMQVKLLQFISKRKKEALTNIIEDIGSA